MNAKFKKGARLQFKSDAPIITPIMIVTNPTVSNPHNADMWVECTWGEDEKCICDPEHLEEVDSGIPPG